MSESKSLQLSVLLFVMANALLLWAIGLPQEGDSAVGTVAIFGASAVVTMMHAVVVAPFLLYRLRVRKGMLDQKALMIALGPPMISIVFFGFAMLGFN